MDRYHHWKITTGHSLYHPAPPDGETEGRRGLSTLLGLHLACQGTKWLSSLRSALSPWFLRHQHEGHSGGRPWRCPLPREPRDVNHENPHSRRAARAPNPEGHQEPAHHVLAASTAELGSRCAALWHQRFGKQAKLNETAARLRRDIWTRRGAGAAGAAGRAWRRTSWGKGKAVLSGNSKSRARKGRSGRKEGNSDAGSQALRAREVEPRTPPSGRRADPVPRPGACSLLGSVLNLAGWTRGLSGWVCARGYGTRPSSRNLEMWPASQWLPVHALGPSGLAEEVEPQREPTGLYRSEVKPPNLTGEESEACTGGATHLRRCSSLEERQTSLSPSPAPSLDFAAGPLSKPKTKRGRLDKVRFSDHSYMATLNIYLDIYKCTSPVGRVHLEFTQHRALCWGHMPPVCLA
ncbi:PREDICTED: uncharacterized protein LOC108536955 [Rhinopithecus bieti]|uniref:uncharacterized protein LOC108536955 n=1 Tax=Rhinopithecus bieti TaxID=61621 RepID=UPI00083BEE5E|nr:PREDICTED: uncharacterized protein LOC108536955 [Rhinopithecus bieti]